MNHRVKAFFIVFCFVIASFVLLNACSSETAEISPTAGPFTVVLYGKEFPSDTKEIHFSGDEIDGFGEILEKLRYFDSLELVDFGQYAAEAEEAERVKEAFGDIAVILRSYVSMCGREFDSEQTAVNLKGLEAGYIPELKEKLKDFPYLESVDLHETDISSDQQEELIEAYPGIRFLWDVSILGKKYDSETERLDFSNRKDLSMDAIRKFIPLFCHLKQLDLSDCGFANETLAALRDEFPDTKIVWRIYMGKWNLKTDAVAFSVLIYNFNYVGLRNKDIEVLKYCTDLQALDLGHQKITDVTVIGEYLKELRILILADNRLTSVAPLAKLKHLHYLELFVNPNLTDISPLGECKEMVDLNIGHLYSVTDISNLLDFPIIERFWIQHTGVSASDIQRVKDAYPNATVTSQGYGSTDEGWREHARYFAMIDMFRKTDYISDEFSKYDSKQTPAPKWFKKYGLF